MLITGGLNDPRVTYWEPAKWAARLRATKTDGNVLLLKINMGAGHGGKSGRWDGLQEVAEAYAFVLTQMGERVSAGLRAIDRRAAEHIDELGHVNNAVWVQWIQESRSRIGRRSPTPAHDDAYFWVVVRHEIDYLRAAFDGDRIVGADLGRRSAEGRALRPAHGIHRRRRQGLRPRADTNGRSSTRPPAGRSASRPKSWRRFWAKLKLSRRHDRPSCTIISARRRPIACGSRSISRASIIERHSVNLADGEQKGPGYRALNPQGLVPLLEIDGQRLTQSLAIMVYLDQTLPEPPFDAARSRRRRACPGDGAGHRLRHPPAQQFARAQISERQARPARRGHDAWYRHWVTEGFTALEAMADPARRRFHVR